MASPNQSIDITSANAQCVMTVEEIYSGGFTVEMFTEGSGVQVAQQQLAETRFGVDGQMVAGYTPAAAEVTFVLEAASPTARNFSTLRNATKTNQRIYRCNLVVTLPSIRKTYNFSGGAMIENTPMPELATILGANTYLFRFANVDETDI